MIFQLLPYDSSLSQKPQRISIRKVSSLLSRGSVCTMRRCIRRAPLRVMGYSCMALSTLRQHKVRSVLSVLGVVIGNLQLLDRSVAETPTLARKVHTAMRAAAPGTSLHADVLG